jgi:hypothetical protein
MISDSCPCHDVEDPHHHHENAIESLNSLASAHEYIAYDIATSEHGLEAIFLQFLYNDAESAVYASTAKLISNLATNNDFVGAAVKASPPCLWRLLREACLSKTSSSSSLWAALESFATHPQGIDYMIRIGAIIRLLGVMVAAPGYHSSFQNRLSAISLLSKFLWNPVQGAEAANMTRRFLPEPVVVHLRGKAGNASLQVLDDSSEHPELIWTKEMQTELRDAINQLTLSSAGGSKTNLRDSFASVIELTPEYTVRYRQLEEEIYLGGVYIRLYLKQPSYRLSNPVLFLEKLLEFWEHAFQTQVPLNVSSAAVPMADTSSRDLILGQEDFLSLLTSCMICVMKGEPSVLEHLLSWSLPTALNDHLSRAISTRRRGIPVTCIIRLFHQLVTKVETIDMLGAATSTATSTRSIPNDIVTQLTRVLDMHEIRGVPKDQYQSSKRAPYLPIDAAVVVELLKKIFQAETCRYRNYLVTAAIQAQLPIFLLDQILGASAQELEGIRNTSALRIHTIDLLKAIIAADETQTSLLKSLLDLHPAWAEFRDQSHDLYLTDQEKTDYFLIEDAIGQKIAGLLTDGKAREGLAQMFGSTGNYAASQYNDPAATFSAGEVAHPPTTTMSTPSFPIQETSYASPPSRAAGASVPTTAPTAAAPVPATNNKPIATASPAVASMPSRATPAAPVSKTTTATASMQKRLLKTIIIKSVHGIGLDITKTNDGGVLIQRLKEMPDGSPNPASICKPPVEVGDIIVGVNGREMRQFVDIVKAIRLCADQVELMLERG